MFPLNLMNSDYLEKTLPFLKLEPRKLARISGIIESKLIKKMFAISFRLLIYHLSNNKINNKNSAMNKKL